MINKADQTITIEPIADKLVTDAAFDVMATSTSGLALTYSISGPAGIAGTTITLDGTPGTVTVTADQIGNDNYNASAASLSFEITDVQVLGVDDELELRAYPNPITSRIYLAKDREVKILSWKISDLNGAIVKEGLKIDDSGIEMEGLREGMYFIHLSTNKGKHDIRIIKR